MLESITIGQIAALIAFVVALYGGIKYLKKELKDGVIEMLKDEFKSTDEKLDRDNRRINELEKNIGDIKNMQTQTLKALRVILDELEHNNDVDGKIARAKTEMDEFLINR